MKAFPNQGKTKYGVGGIKYQEITDEGMDLRDYFAAKALQGFLANPETAPNEVNVIAACWGIADAMMKARESK